MIVLSFLSLLFILFIVNGIVVNTMFFGSDGKNIEKFDLSSALEFESDVIAKLDEIGSKIEQSKKVFVYYPKRNVQLAAPLEVSNEIQILLNSENIDEEFFDNQFINGGGEEKNLVLELEFDELYDGEYEEIVFEDEFSFE